MDNKWGVEGQVKVIDLSFYAPFKEYGDTIICCFAYAFFFWRTYLHITDIINGTGGQIVEIKGSEPVQRNMVKGFRK